MQVEHPVSEETAGIDLVRQQFAIANGERLSITTDPEPRGHAFEFRINGEDPGRDFLPGPGRIEAYREPAGPGVRVDSGVVQGSVVSGRFDSLLAKLIVTGEDRMQALERSRRALAEFTIDGLATVLPFHRHIVEHPAFIGSTDDTGAASFDVYTRWIETEWENSLPPYAPTAGQADDVPVQTLIVEVDGRRVEVSVRGALGDLANRPTPTRAPAPEVADDAVVAPMPGTVVKVTVQEGDEVAAGDLVVVLEAMKMESPITAPRSGTVSDLLVEAGVAVNQGAPLLRIT